MAALAVASLPFLGSKLRADVPLDATLPTRFRPFRLEQLAEALPIGASHRLPRALRRLRRAAGKRIGRITSAIYSPRLKKNIGYAMVPIQNAELGSKLTISIPDVGDREATVVPKPFVDPEKAIPKS